MALAYLIGTQEHVEDLNTALDLRVDDAQVSGDPEEQRAVADWLGSFLFQVHEGVGRLTPRAQKELWDLNCVGQTIYSAFGEIVDVPTSASTVQSVGPAFAEYDALRHTISVLGDVTAGYANRIEAAILAYPDATRIGLGSSGGNVSEAIAAARVIRSHHIGTVLTANCYSACPLVFLGGVNENGVPDRIMYDPPYEIGFHMLSADGVTSVPVNHEVYAIIEDFVAEMGADGETYVGWMLKSRPGDDLFIVGWDALCDANIVTWAQRRCW